ncbi:MULTISPECIES: glycosyltransferase family 1 protein [unclassified Pseudodesulfovibrio]|uniref:glycosyltransferase family 4 protein n=1 Tax=unclassified Pseudodesulfovibrio TaxID=2661612 RepID=UPI0013E3335D|nr:MULTISPECIES: glycosyltransferase family 1 protein [unclassified Pseudodesulfovibrio]MCJ2164998.1 glycosyltransferase family 4 protein [Pseudodesulfovibrio sp. S3-i]
MKNILINALPMTVVGTGIGRYLRGLAGAVEAGYGGAVRLSYFVGDRVVDEPPAVRGAGWRERLGQLLWRMPHPVGYGARLVRHAWTEKCFRHICSGYDVYHEAGYFPFKPSEKVRTVLTVHDLSLLRFPEWHPRERVCYAQRFFLERLDLVDGFCAVSEFTKREMVEHLSIDPARIIVTPLGFDNTLFNEADDPEAQKVLVGAGMPEKFILFVGSGDPRKKLDLALAALEKSRNPLPLVTVGWSGWSRMDAPGVFNMGYVTDRVLAQLYRKAELLVMPSQYEGFGLPVLEAMACGCPVLTSDAEALLEIGGDAVESVRDVRDADLFARRLDALCDSIAQRTLMRERGRNRAREFSWERTARTTVGAW